MKRKIIIHLGTAIIVALVLLLILNYRLQISSAQDDMVRVSQGLFQQIDTIIRQNEEDLSTTQQDIRENCLKSAETAAYILQQDKSIIKNKKKVQKIANMLQVDEIHLFDKKGKMFAGMRPEFYGLNFHSGEQMEFFLPMLKDTSLKLCQDITPNTAEARMMQYAAVWMKDGSAIVQVGLEPKRVLEQTKENDLAHIFSKFTDDTGATLIVIDPETNTVLGATNEELLEKGIYELGIKVDDMRQWGKGFFCDVNSVPSYCVFTKKDSVILGRTYSTIELYRNVNDSNVNLIMYMIVIFLVVMLVIIWYLDRNVIHSIAKLNLELQSITDGDLDKKVDVENNPEFAELSNHINNMVESILESTDKLSRVLYFTKQPIGVYEYNNMMDRVRVTSRVQEILHMPDKEAEFLFENRELFENWMKRLSNNPVEGEENIYAIPGEDEHYVKFEMSENGNQVFGILIDKTADVSQRIKMKEELGQDALTGLASRRFFNEWLDKLSKEPQTLKCGAIVMVDSDDLKKMNDTYGHENGDRYLCATGMVLKGLEAPNQITARLGGDEFSILFYGLESSEDVKMYLAKLQTLRDTQTVELTDGTQGDIRFSYGVAMFPDEEGDLQSLLKYADTRMYEDKLSRKGNKR